MSQKASEIFKYARHKRTVIDQANLKSLKERAVEAVTEMMKAGSYVTEIKLVDKDMQVIQKLTKEIRNLGYLYCLIEVQDESETILDYRLRISIEHLDNQ